MIEHNWCQWTAHQGLEYPVLVLQGFQQEIGVHHQPLIGEMM